MGNRYIWIDETSYSVNTDEECAAAAAALREAGLPCADVFAGEPDDPSSYRDGRQLFQSGAILFS